MPLNGSTQAHHISVQQRTRQREPGLWPRHDKNDFIHTYVSSVLRAEKGTMQIQISTVQPPQQTVS